MERLLLRLLRDAGAPPPPTDAPPLRSAAHGPVDLVVDLPGGTTVGELADHLAGASDDTGARDPGAEATGGSTIEVVWPPELATGPLDPARPVRTSGPPSGSTVRVVHRPRPDPAARPLDASPVVLVGAGGVTRRLDYGENDVHGVRIDVGASIELCSTGVRTGTRNGARVRGSARVSPGDLIGAGDLLAVVRVDGPLLPPPAAGTTVEHASLRAPDVADEARPVDLPEPPGSARIPGFPVLSAMVPLLMGVGLWVATRSVAAAAFVFFSFVFVVASGIEVRRESRGEARFREEEFRAELADVLDRHDALRRSERDQAERVTPGGAGSLTLIDRADPRVWTVRPLDGRPPRLPVSVGVADQVGRHRLVVPRQGRRDLRRELDELVADRGTHRLPVRVDLFEQGGLAVVGGGEAATDLATSLVLQAAAAAGPDQLSIEVLAGPAHVERWSWTTWLPHVTAELADASSRSRLLVVDGAPDDQVVAALGERAGAERAVAVLWLSATAVGLPRHLGCTVEVDEHEATLHRLGDHAEVVQPIEPDVLHEDEVLPRARRLAAWRPGGSTVDLGPGDDDTAARSSRAAPPSARLAEVLAHPELIDDTEGVLDTWAASRDRGGDGLAAPIGRAGAGVVSVDLELDGPHTLVAGTTGSGKSELLRTLLGSMALRHPPDRLTFLLVDYKGGAAFRSLVALPHTVGLVTDLSGALAARALVSLRAEVTRRERLLEHHGAGDLAALRRDLASRADAPPSLVVAVDEFATLANEVPGFVDGLVDVAQRGRSLGIHLLLATQRPAGVITDHIRANTSLRICLRVADDDESRDVIGVPDAGRVERATPGRAIVRIGADRPFPVQVAWSGGGEADDELLRSHPLHEPGLDTVLEPEVHPALSPLDRAVGTIGAAARAEGRAAPRRPWLEPLPEQLAIADLLSAAGLHDARTGRVRIGLRDRPREQQQDALDIDLDRDGGVLVLGANRSGRTTTLATIATAAAGHPVDPAHVYAISSDVGLDALTALDGVGDVVRADEIERSARLVRAVHTEVRRRRGGTTGPRLVLLVDGFAPLEELHERINRGELVEQLLQIARDGRTVGVHLVLAAHRRAEVPPSLAAALGCRIDLRFPTEDDAAMAGCDPSAADRDRPPGRCVVDGVEAQVAMFDAPPTPGTAGASSAPPPVPALPDLVRRSHVVSSADLSVDDSGSRWEVVAGIDADTLSPIALDLEHHHAIVAGPARSGRSSTLATIAASFESAFLIRARTPTTGPPDGVWSRAWSPLATGCSFEDVVDSALAAAEQGHPTLLAVDDLPELLDGPDEALLESMLLGVIQRSLTLPIRLVASGEIDAMTRCYGDLMTKLRSGRTGVLLRPDPDLHGGLLHASLSARDDLPPGPGRGWLVGPGTARPVQVAVV